MTYLPLQIPHIRHVRAAITVIPNAASGDTMCPCRPGTAPDCTRRSARSIRLAHLRAALAVRFRVAAKATSPSMANAVSSTVSMRFFPSCRPCGDHTVEVGGAVCRFRTYVATRDVRSHDNGRQSDICGQVTGYPFRKAA